MARMHSDQAPLDITALERALARVPSAKPLPWALGFMTAGLSAPALPRPLASYQWILGDVELGSIEEAQEVFNALMAVNNELVDRLREGRPAGPPRRDDAFVVAWCQGFLAGFDTEGEAPLGEEELMCLVPIAAIAGEVSATGSDDDDDPTRAQAKAATFAEALESWKTRLDETVAEIHETFAVARYEGAQRMSTPRASRTAGTYRRTEDKVGRNEPCPCGSGKKHKRCCGG